MQKEIYKLIGVVNETGKESRYLIPIFERKGKFFIQKGSKETVKATIEEFVEVDSSFIKNRKKVKRDNFFADSKIGYHVGSEMIQAIKVDPNIEVDDNFKVGKTSEILWFAWTYKATGELKEFLTEIIDKYFSN